MDITDPSSPIPTYQGSILLKASRVAAANVSSSEPTASKPATSAPAEKSAPPVPKPPRPQPQHQPSEKLLSFNDDDGHVGEFACKRNNLLSFPVVISTRVAIHRS